MIDTTKNEKLKDHTIMLRILKWSENGFVPSDTIERHCLINVTRPEKGELEKLSEEMRNS